MDEKTSDFITDAPILIPEGISVINETGMPIRSVEVQVSISPINGYLVVDREVLISSPPDDVGITVNPGWVSVLLTGPQFLLNEVEKDSNLVVVKVYLTDTSPGIYQVIPQVQAPSGLQVQLFPKEVQVKIE